MLAPLTPRQKQILEFINLYYDINHISPSLEEIRKHFNLKAVSTVHEHIEKLKAKGYIHKEMNQARGIKTTSQSDLGDDMTEINVLGKIAAGEPIEAIELPEPLLVNSAMVSKKGDYFGLIVKGDSMIEDGIHSDDIVVVKSQATAEDGDTIVAIVDGENATLKRFYKEKDRVRLQPANSNLQAKFYRNIEIRGKVIALLRTYD
jgi:repressor LexA